MKFNFKFIFLLFIILFFIYVIIHNYVSLPSVIYREGLEVNGVDISGIEIMINGSINDDRLTLSSEPKSLINTGDILLDRNGNIIKSISGDPITIEIGDGLTYYLSETPVNVIFKTRTDYIIFGLMNENRKTKIDEPQNNINGKLDTSMNLILSTKPNMDIQPGNVLLFNNGDNVYDISKNPIRIVSGSGLIYKLSSVADPEYDLYDKNTDYILDASFSSM
jgi:hypothetical protein